MGRVIAIQNSDVASALGIDRERALTHLAASGAFAEEAKRLQALLDEVNAKLEISDTLDEAKRLKAAAQALFDEKYSEVTALLGQAKEKVAVAVDRLKGVESREADLRDKLAQLAGTEQRSKEALDKREQALASRELTSQAGLAEREAAITAAEQEIAAERRRLAEDRVTLNARLEALKL